MFRTFFTVPALTRCAKPVFVPRLPQETFTRGFRTTIPKQSTYKRFSDSANGGTRSKRLLDWRRWDPQAKFGVALLTVAGGYYVAHLEQVPETGRWRFMNTSHQTEAEIGDLVRAQTKLEYQDQILPQNHPLSIHVRRVTSRILQHSNLGRLRGEPPSNPPHLIDGFWTPEDEYRVNPRETYGPEKEWDVVVVNDKRVVNASASPGLIIVYTGILPVCKDEQGLAAVLSHEIAHVVARHSAEAISSRTIMLALLVALQAIGIDWGISSAFQTYFLELPNSRTQELEADLIGLRLMSRACYDPKAAPEMFERLGQVSGSSGREFMNTHPSSARRVKQLEEALPNAYSILAANPECTTMRENVERFREHTRAIRIDDYGNTQFV